MKLVSIVSPVYNSAEFLHETIQSVLDQTYQNWELILVDDGSTDESARVIDEYVKDDNRISYYYKENGGQASARNVGIQKAKGEYISFLDSDDILLKNKLEDQLQELAEFQPDFLYGAGYFYYPDREEKLEKYDWIYGHMTGMEFFHILYHSCSVNTNTVIVKKSLLDEVGFFNENELMRGLEDWDLWMRIAKKVKKVYGSPARNVYYRIHEGGIHLQNVRMKRGKAVIFEQYDNDKDISRQVRLKEYRYTYRELMNFLHKEDRSDDIKGELKKLAKKDKFGLTTLWQRLLVHLLPTNSFMWVSNKILYRIGYRLESVVYWIF